MFAEDLESTKHRLKEQTRQFTTRVQALQEAVAQAEQDRQVCVCSLISA